MNPHHPHHHNNHHHRQPHRNSASPAPGGAPFHRQQQQAAASQNPSYTLGQQSNQHVFKQDANGVPFNIQVDNKPVFNGRRMREQKERKMIDAQSTIITEYTQRRLYRPAMPYRVPYYMPPQLSYERILLPMSSTIGNESQGLLTRLERMSKNMERSPINVIAFTPSGRRLLTANAKGEFTLWDGKGFHFITIQHAHDEPIRAMTWDHAGRFLVSGDGMGKVKYWEITMNFAKELNAHGQDPSAQEDPMASMRHMGTRGNHHVAVRDISFAPNDVSFVTCSDDCTLKLWNFQTAPRDQKPINTFKGHGSEVQGCEWHPYHALIASASKDHSVRLWDVKSGKQAAIMESHKSAALKVRWNRNGNWLLSASRDQLIQLHDIRYLKPMSTFNGHKNAVHCIRWHPFHERLFASGAYDGNLMYWIVGTSEEEGPAAVIPQAHNQRIWELDWHPLGHVLCSGSQDGTIKFWIRERCGEVSDNTRHRSNYRGEDED